MFVPCCQSYTYTNATFELLGYVIGTSGVLIGDNKHNRLKIFPHLIKYINFNRFFFSVSFQQSSIYAVRSFSASFPGRRCSMAAGLYHTNNVPSQMQKIQEKRAPVGVLEDESNVAKRRLVKTKSAPTEKRLVISSIIRVTQLFVLIIYVAKRQHDATLRRSSAVF